MSLEGKIKASKETVPHGQRSARKLTRKERRQLAMIERWNRAGRAQAEAAEIAVLREALKRYGRRRCELMQRRMEAGGRV